MKTWAWATSLVVTAAIGLVVWTLQFRAGTYCSGAGASAYQAGACAIAANDAIVWSWVAVVAGVLAVAVALWIGRGRPETTAQTS
jgi:hypothetical protein